MIILPAIGAIVAAAAPLVEAALIAAGIGAVFGGVACGVGTVASGVHSQGALNREISVSAVHRAGECAVEGAVIGGATGAVAVVVAPVVAPAIQVVDDVARPVVQIADDVARPVMQAVDDASRPVFRAVDDALGSGIKQTRKTVSRVGKGIVSRANHAINSTRARFFQRLPKTTEPAGYVYVMDDTAAGVHKIGMTTNPAQRLSQVQKTVGRELNFSCIISTDNMRALESVLHTAFASQNLPNTGIGREWFNLTPAQVTAACSY